MTDMERHELLPKAKPILFNTEMVMAIMNGRKTVTRRAIKPQPKYAKMTAAGLMTSERPIFIKNEFAVTECGNVITWNKMRYSPGDILYVRETFFEYKGRFYYKADGKHERLAQLGVHFRWHPSIHMPKEAARIFLRVTGVRVERLHEITSDDILDEGAEKLILCPDEHGVIEPDGTLGDMCWNTECCGGNCKYIEKSYGELFGEIVWNDTIKKSDLEKYGWTANPWVWVIEFERC